MRHLRVALRDILVDLDSDNDLREVSIDEALVLVRQAFEFLPDLVDARIDGDEAVIECRDLKPGKAESAHRLFEKGVAAAGKGEYVKAADLFQRALLDLPDNPEARRNLSMAYLEAGQPDKAKKHLRELLCLAPRDQWGLLLAANLFSKHEKNKPLAAKFYAKAYELDPSDPFIITSYAALLLEMGKVGEARSMFEESIATVPGYPNPYLGLAMLFLTQEEPHQALRVIDDLFTDGTAVDPRSATIFEEARRLFAQVNDEIARDASPDVDAFLSERREEIEAQSGCPITIKEDPSLEVASKTELAWKYGTDSHRILYRPTSNAILQHYMARAIEHIAMESEARATGRNLKFISTPTTHEIALSAIGKDLYKLRDLGMPDGALNDYMLQIVQGTISLLYNCPLDMVTEYRLFLQYPLIRPHQFVSLNQTMGNNLEVAKNRDIKRTTPGLIYRASLAMNYAYALCIDHIYHGKTAFSAAYPTGDYQPVGHELFEVWKEAVEDFSPSDEYRLMQTFANTLGIKGWFEVVPDLTKASFSGYDPPPTDQDLLKEREPAVMMYLLSALQRFDAKSPEDVKSIALEISLVGMEGITFTDPDKRYNLKSLPGEDFTGLQLLALMYVSWKQVDPSMDTGLDFDTIYRTALEMYRGPKS